MPVGCYYTYSFNEDTTMSIVATSGEVADGHYSLYPTTTAAQRFRLSYTISADNGKPDCAGRDHDDTGRTEMAFLVFNEDRSVIEVFGTNAVNADPKVIWYRAP